jgi:hypothetical protein
MLSIKPPRQLYPQQDTFSAGRKTYRWLGASDRLPEGGELGVSNVPCGAIDWAREHKSFRDSWSDSGRLLVNREQQRERGTVVRAGNRPASEPHRHVCHGRVPRSWSR